MNKTTTILITTTALAALFLGFSNASLAQNPDGHLWRVFQTDIHPDDELVLVGDTFRLMKTGNHYMLKPLPPMSNRWGNAENYMAKLDEKADNLYCGSLELKSRGHQFVHGLSLSIVDIDSHVILEFGEEGICKYNTVPSHGGLAHAER